MSLPVISVAQMREWERETWATGQTEQAVIARVGEALVWPINRVNEGGGRTLILAGKGHNGDDARAIESHLIPGTARVLDVVNPAAALEQLVAILQNEKPTLIVDGLFGIGLNRTLNDDWQKLIETVNAAGSSILAIDVPSGLNADTGEALPIAIRATETWTVGAPKRGLLASAAADHVGQLRVLTDVGLAPCRCVSDLQWTEAKDFSNFPPPRPAGGHKGIFGHVAIVAGSAGYHGASVLAARGAQRARPGLVTLFTQPELYAAVASQLQATMVHVWRDTFDVSKFSTVLFGPGLAEPDLPASVREVMHRLWHSATVPAIVDASALDWLRPGAVVSTAARVITPHPGEAARLLQSTTAAVQKDRPGAVRKLSQLFGHCWVVLKGRHTLVGRAEGDLFVNSSGNVGLAQGGTGDLLAGYLAGWLAQPACQRDPLTCLRYAVWEHGAAAERLSERRKSWVVEDLAAELGG